MTKDWSSYKKMIENANKIISKTLRSEEKPVMKFRFPLKNNMMIYVQKAIRMDIEEMDKF